MPVNRVSGGFGWDTTGKTDPTRRPAEARYASGYRKNTIKPTKGQSRGKKT